MTHKMLLHLLLLCAIIAPTVALPPHPPADMNKLPAYVDTHAPALMQEYARMSLTSKNPGGVSEEAIAKMATIKLNEMRSQPKSVQLKQLKHMHSRLSAP